MKVINLLWAKLTLVVLGIALSAGVAAGSSESGHINSSEDISLPPEVRALIGMKIPPVIKGKASGSIPGFFGLGSSAAMTGSGSDAIIEGSSVGFQTGVLASGRPMLFVTGHDKDLTTKIFDALMLPPDLIDWYFEGDFEYALQHDQAHPDRYFKWYWQTGQTGRFVLSETCRSHEDDERIIIGLIKQQKGKEGCSHYTKRVKQAWLIDKQSGRLMPISTKGLQCHYITVDDCY